MASKPAVQSVSELQHQLSKSQVDALCEYVLSKQYANQTETLGSNSGSSNAGNNSIPDILNGRKVLVPVRSSSGRSKAFRIGKLTPQRNDGQELVELHGTCETQNGTQPATCKATLSEARQWLRPTSRTSGATSATANNTHNKPQDTPPPLAGRAKKVTGNRIGPDHSAGVPSHGETLPLFDIQEEFDAAGKPVRSQAVNVTKHFEKIMNEHRKQQAAESKEDRDEFSVDDAVVDAQFDGSGGDTDGAVSSETVRVEKKNTVSDDEYQRLASRLDQLALLEEEEETRASQSRSSVTRTSVRRHERTKKPTNNTSKGWAKGFLHGKAAKAPGTATKTGTTVQPSGSSSSPSPSPVDTVVSKPAHGAETAETPQRSTQKKMVSFGENETKEIPRVGNTSVSSIRKPQAAAKTIESSVFSGVVQERPAGIVERPSAATGRRKGRTRRTAQQSESKKLSRFAQERRGEY